MKLGEIINKADALKPNAFGNEQKTDWINAIEGQIHTDVLLLSVFDYSPYHWPEDENSELLVWPPHDKLYISYLLAMIDFGNGEYNNYTNTMIKHNADFCEYVAWYARNYQPANMQAMADSCSRRCE